MMADRRFVVVLHRFASLAVMRWTDAKPDGLIIETPITANSREVLTYFSTLISLTVRRKGLGPIQAH